MYLNYILIKNGMLYVKRFRASIPKLAQIRVWPNKDEPLPTTGPIVPLSFDLHSADATGIVVVQSANIGLYCMYCKVLQSMHDIGWHFPLHN